MGITMFSIETSMDFQVRGAKNSARRQPGGISANGSGQSMPSACGNTCTAMVYMIISHRRMIRRAKGASAIDRIPTCRSTARSRGDFSMANSLACASSACPVFVRIRKPCRNGVDLGGTKIEAIALGADGTILARHRVPTPVGDYAGTLDAVAGLVGTIEQQLGRQGSVGVGTPGAISSRTGLIKNSNSTVLIGKRLDQDLAAKLQRPVRLANDANCFALSEAAMERAPAQASYSGSSSAPGSAAVWWSNARSWPGATILPANGDTTPCPGRAPMSLPGAPCYCGKAGCIETFLSGPGLARAYQAETGKVLDGRGRSASGRGRRAAGGRVP